MTIMDHHNWVIVAPIISTSLPSSVITTITVQQNTFLFLIMKRNASDNNITIIQHYSHHTTFMPQSMQHNASHYIMTIITIIQHYSHHTAFKPQSMHHDASHYIMTIIQYYCHHTAFMPQSIQHDASHYIMTIITIIQHYWYHTQFMPQSMHDVTSHYIMTIITIIQHSWHHTAFMPQFMQHAVDLKLILMKQLTAFSSAQQKLATFQNWL